MLAAPVAPSGDFSSRSRLMSILPLAIAARTINPNRNVTIRPPYSTAYTTFLSGSPGTQIAIMKATTIAPSKLIQNALFFMILSPINYISDAKEHRLGFSTQVDCLTAAESDYPRSRDFRKLGRIADHLKHVVPCCQDRGD